jgi:hypothetical protein
MLLHKKNDSLEARSRSLMRYAVGRRVCRIALDAEQELRADQREQAHALRRVESSGGSPLLL